MIAKMQPTPTAEKRLDAIDIGRILAERHKEDVYVDQCKDGPTQGSRVLILDAWAMKKSWANPCVTGYEIKVSRSDFQRDDKWYGYLPYCNEFYFVCPAGMLKPEEIPEPAGLLCASKTGGVLFRKKKATRRNVEIPLSIYQYILMSRVKVTREFNRQSKREFWEEWLKTEATDKNFGWNVRGRLAKVIKERIETVEQENKSLREKMDRYDSVRKMLASLDINPDKWFYTHHVQESIERVRSAVPPDLKSSLESMQRGLTEFSKALAEIENPEKGNEHAGSNDGD